MWQVAIKGEPQGIFFWVAIYTLTLCLYSLVRQIQTRYWPFVYGEIVNLGVGKFGAPDLVRSDQDYISTALYTYNVSGVSYDGKRLSPWIFVTSHNARFALIKQLSAIQLLPDGKVKVFYNPRNPKKCFLIIAGKIGIFITFLISVLPLFLYFLKYHA